MPDKTCRECGMTKPLLEFHRDSGSRDGRKNRCKDCLCARSRAGMAEKRRCNPDAVAASRAAWRFANPEKARAAEKAAKRSYYQRNRERWNAGAKLWHSRNPEKTRQAQRDWDRRNPEKIREKVARRKARKRQARVGVVDYGRILRRDDSWCYICWTPVAEGDAQFDHVVALSRGGAHSEGNIRVVHARCNNEKSDKPIGVVVAG